MSTSDFFKPLPPGAPPERIPFLVTSSGAAAGPGPGAVQTRPDPLANVPKTYLKGRTKEHVDVNTAPYHDTGSTIGKGKKFTLKGRPAERAPVTEAGPEYVPPAFGSDARGATVHIRTQDKPPEVTPGPGQYNDTNTLGKNARKSTFHGPRERSLAVQDRSPGPGAYLPSMPNTPRISIGHRWNDGKIEVTPGPGQYKVDRFGPNKSKGNIGVRLTNRSESIGPGPAEYDTQRGALENLPKIHLHGRTEQKTEVNQAPYRVIKRVQDTPAYSMRSRYYTSSETTPGVDYVPPAFGKDSRKVGIGVRLSKKQDESGPGPGAYKPKTDKDLGSARKSTFHGPRTRSVEPKDLSPGPAEYGYDYHCVKPNSPRFTMKGARYEPKRDQSGEYVYVKPQSRGPRFSFGARPSLSVAYG